MGVRVGVGVRGRGRGRAGEALLPPVALGPVEGRVLGCEKVLVGQAAAHHLSK